MSAVLLIAAGALVLVAALLVVALLWRTRRLTAGQATHQGRRETRAERRVRKAREYEATGDPEITLVLPLRDLRLDTDHDH